MGKIYNRKTDTDKRRKLRCNMPEAEKKLWYCLRKKRIHGIKFRRQFSIGGFVVDFYCPAAKLAIEVDGDYHSLPEVYHADLKRQKAIEKFGITFLRFSNGAIYARLGKVIEEIEKRLTAP